MAARKIRKKPQQVKKTQPVRKKFTIKEKENSSGILNFFRFGESYSSLLLGIIVVIITTILLVLLVRDRNGNQITGNDRNISSTSTELAKSNLTPTKAFENTGSVSATIKPTATLSVKPSPTPTMMPTKIVTKPTKILPTAAVTKLTEAPTRTQDSLSKTLAMHTVSKGDSLWSIAEKYYRSGYNWVDISRANELPNPGIIVAGMKLIIPEVKAKEITVIAQAQQSSVFGPKITGTTYKIEKGDHLWGIAVRAFNDGYKWVEIAKLNNIKSPNVIQPGLILKLPRLTTPTPVK